MKSSTRFIAAICMLLLAAPLAAQTQINLQTQVKGALPVSNGGTGATSTTGSGANVLATSPTLNSPSISGGTVNNAPIGGTTPAAVTGTTVKGNTAVQTAGYFQGTTPTVVTATSYTALGTDNFVQYAATATSTVTLGTATAGRMLWIRNSTAFAINSAGLNVVPLNSTTAAAPILAATAGKWALLVGNGTNWVIMAGN